MAASAQALNASLCIAAADGDADECQRLLLEGADANAQSKYGLAALALASASGHSQAARRLLEAGAAPDTIDRKGSTVLSSACDAGFVDLCSVLVNASADVGNAAGPERRTALHNSCRNSRSTKCLPLLLPLCTDVAVINLVDYQGATALGLACKNGHADAVASLLKSGADPSVQWLASDALALARASGSDACVRLLQSFERSKSEGGSA